MAAPSGAVFLCPRALDCNVGRSRRVRIDDGIGKVNPMEIGQPVSPVEPAQPEPIWPPLHKQTFTPAEPPEAALDQPALNGAVVMPRAPESVGEIGLSPSFLLEHVIKVIHYAETPTAEHVARVVGLPTRIMV